MENIKAELKKEGHLELLAGGILSAIAGAEATAGAVAACGAGACTLGAAAASAVAFTCPFCVAGGVALLGYGAYRKMRAKGKK